MTDYEVWQKVTILDVKTKIHEAEKQVNEILMQLYKDIRVDFEIKLSDYDTQRMDQYSPHIPMVRVHPVMNP